jgi:hypothetical protein
VFLPHNKPLDKFGNATIPTSMKPEIKLRVILPYYIKNAKIEVLPQVSPASNTIYCIFIKSIYNICYFLPQIPLIISFF